jgi:hypothetical protein
MATPKHKKAMKQKWDAIFIDNMIRWIDSRFDETHSEIILKGEKRNYVIVPNNRDNKQ